MGPWPKTIRSAGRERHQEHLQGDHWVGLLGKGVLRAEETRHPELG
jgi:hypothetical protein